MDSPVGSATGERGTAGRISGLIAFGLALGLGCVATAQPTATGLALIDQLASDNFVQREVATSKLIEDQSLPLGELEKILAGDGLSLEQRQRLLRVARERFERSPRGAMGVQFGGNLRDRIVIDRTFGQFAATRMLEEGDMIVEAAGVPIRGPSAQRTLKAIVIAHDPDTRLPLTVRRGAEKLVIELPLGRFTDLPSGALLSSDVARAWRFRSERYTASGDGRAGLGPIETGMKAGLEAQTPTARMANRQERSVRLKGMAATLPLLAAGGQPGSEAVPAEWAGMAQVRQQARAGARQFFVNGMAVDDWEWDVAVGLPPMTAGQEISELRAAFEKLSAELATAPGRGLLPDERIFEAGDRGEKVRRLRLIEKQLRAVESEINETGASGREGAVQTESAGVRADEP